MGKPEALGRSWGEDDDEDAHPHSTPDGYFFSPILAARGGARESPRNRRRAPNLTAQAGRCQGMGTRGTVNPEHIRSTQDSTESPGNSEGTQRIAAEEERQRKACCRLTVVFR